MYFLRFFWYCMQFVHRNTNLLWWFPFFPHVFTPSYTTKNWWNVNEWTFCFGLSHDGFICFFRFLLFCIANMFFCFIQVQANKRLNSRFHDRFFYFGFIWFLSFPFVLFLQIFFVLFWPRVNRCFAFVFFCKYVCFILCRCK